VATDYIHAFLRPPQISLPELVTALREIHERKSIRASPQPTDRTTTADDPAGDRLLDPYLLLLERVVSSADGLDRLLKPWSGEPPRSSEASRYASLQGGIRELEKELRRHGEFVDRLLGPRERVSAEPSGATINQQTLYLQCPRAGGSAGRFRCVNRRTEQVSVTSFARPFTQNLERLAPAPMLSLRPDAFTLDAGASAVITAEVDFAPCPQLASGVLQASIDLRTNDAMPAKIWIEVELHEQSEASEFRQNDETDSLPTVYLDGSQGALSVLRRLQALVLKHPVAAKAAFGALVAEGEAFARTPEGRECRNRLASSEILHRARLVFDLPGLSMLVREDSGPLPSSYVDAIFMLASGARSEELFEPPPELGNPDAGY
jgi:hypothetical protein